MRLLLRVLLAATSATLLVVALEAASRISYWRDRGVSPCATAADLALAYYPELRAAVPPPPGHARVLLLGASVLNATFGDVPRLLRERLGAAWGREVQVVDLAMLGHASLDSWYKYRELAGQRFDLVIVYHGINELRANNVPPETWRDDYGHYAWYDEINFYFAHERLRRLPFLFPFWLKHAAVVLDRVFVRRDRYVPEHAPRPEWTAYGGDVKTVPVFRRNLERILALAGERGEPVVIMTFAYHLPADYSLERMNRGELGFGHWANASPSPVELWGTPEHVRAGLEAHDRVLRELHAAHPETVFVDQEARLGDDPGNFTDVCHLSPLGAERFVDGIVAAVKAAGVGPRPAVARPAAG